MRDAFLCFQSRVGDGESLSWQLLTATLFRSILYNFAKETLGVYLKVYSEIASHMYRIVSQSL